MNLLIRADASTRIGTGHMMRCLALAQAWQAEGGRAVFLSHCESDALIQRIKVAGIGYIALNEPHPASTDMRQMLDCLKEQHADWLVLDGYHFDPGYQQAVRAAGYRLLVIDDTAHLPEYHADILLNQNLNAERLRYKCDADTALLLGTRYVLLRQEFMAWRGWHREIPPVARKVLVTMGGGDPDNVTLKVIQALQKVGTDDLEAVVAVGSSNPHVEMLQSEVQRSRITIRLEHDVVDMPELMAWTDLAVSAGGTTYWELAFMGVPGVVLTLAENQRHVAEGLDESGVAWNLGWHEQVTPADIAQAISRLLVLPQDREEISCRERGLIDGFGTDRVLMYMRGQKIRLRSVTEEDAELLWRWANDPSVRAFSFSSELIPWQQHLSWFKLKLNSPDCLFYIAIDREERPIGQVRYDVSDHEAIISVSLDADFRGMGYGSAVIELASRKLFRVSNAKIIHSYVKTGNDASVNTFVKAGFQKIGIATAHGQQAVHLILRMGEAAWTGTSI